MKPAHARIGKQREKIGLLRVAIGDRVVALTVVELVVVLVVRRNPHEGWKSVEQRQPVVGERVQLLRLPYGQVIVIVSDHRNRDRHEQGRDEQHRAERVAAPLNDEQGRGDGHVRQSADISCVPKHRGSPWARTCTWRATPHYLLSEGCARRAAGMALGVEVASTQAA